MTVTAAAATERPILFSAPMVRAILDGKKTQTRRVVTPQPSADWDGRMLECVWYHPSIERRGQLEPGPEIFGFADDREGWKCPYGAPGARMYIKESAWMYCERRPNGTTKTGRAKWVYVPLESAPVHYAVDGHKPTTAVVHPETKNQWGWRLKVARFLPRWASRITLEVTDLSVERVQHICEADAIAEGFQGRRWDEKQKDYDSSSLSGRDRFRDLWNDLNAPRGFGWKENPWVWVVEFRRVKP